MGIDPGSLVFSKLDWLHCNICFSQPTDCDETINGIPFFVTSCGHLYCDKCLKNETFVCNICSAKCSAMRISKNLKMDVALFFSDPKEIIKKQYNLLMKVIEFQSGHSKRIEFVHKINHMKNFNTESRHGLNGPKVETRNFECSTERVISSISSKSTPTKTSYIVVKKNKMDEELKSPLSSSSKTYLTPNRIVMRTPPKNGHIGTPPNKLLTNIATSVEASKLRWNSTIQNNETSSRLKTVSSIQQNNAPKEIPKGLSGLLVRSAIYQKLNR